MTTRTRRTYNGHPPYNAWNVSLWINNDEGLYRRAVDLCRRSNRRRAAEQMLSELPAKTPGGAPYTVTNIMRAMEGL